MFDGQTGAAAAGRRSRKPSASAGATAIRLAMTIPVCLAVCVTLAAPALASARIRAQQPTAALLTNHAVRAAPGGTTKPIVAVADKRPITGEQTVLPVLGRVRDQGRIWLRVRLPGRVIGAVTPPRTGWISASHTRLASTPWLLVVDLGARQLTVYKDGRLQRRYLAIVGKPSTPTPTGQYFVEENVTLSKGQAGGPFALASSDRSHVFSEFDGGPGQIAIHGLQQLGGRLGTAESHGCIRLADSAISWLAVRIASGTPLTITTRPAGPSDEPSKITHGDSSSPIPLGSTPRVLLEPST